MKKLTIILLVTVSIVAMTGCSSKKAYEGEDTSESVQVDNSNDSGEIIEIDENSAKELVAERLDTTKYSVEKDSDVTVDNVNYYVFKVLEGDTPLAMGVAVNTISGELYTYNEEKTISPYADFTLSDESGNPAVQWDGKFYNETASLELLPADENSFEFTFTSLAGPDTITGVATISDNDATYEDENDFKITFLKEDQVVTVTESGSSSSDTSFQGAYTE
ncbi:MAG: hypothetical protein ACERKZ_05945 [Lachnotalea sp.]